MSSHFELASSHVTFHFCPKGRDGLLLIKIPDFGHFMWCPPISPNPNSPNPYMFGLGIGLGLGLGIGLGSGFEYFRQYNVIRRIGIRRNGEEPFMSQDGMNSAFCV